MKRWLCAAIALCCGLFLTGCTRLELAGEPVGTLAPAESLYEAPSGTNGMNYTATRTLYLPSTDGQRLLAQYEHLELSRAESSAEALVRALLNYPANEQTASLGGHVNLTLYGQRPVEVSGGVCTVNLASSALQLDNDAFYMVCQALAATLCEMENILHVNVLVADQPVGLDIAGYLPMGAITARPGEDLPALWKQLDAKRTPLGQDASTMPLTATATLYFPLANGTGFMPETRNLIFPGQTPAQLVTVLLQAMSSGAQYVQGASEMPDLFSLLTDAPSVSGLADGSRLITLRFSSNLVERLALLDIDPACMMGAIVYTLTTFIPSVSAVRFMSGDAEIGTVHHATAGTLMFQEGMQRRTQYAWALMERVNVYLAFGDRLKSVSRTVPWATASDPRTLMELLMKGPTADEAAAGYAPVLPGGLERQDVLGVAIHGDTLLLNLSERFGMLIAEQTMNEQLLCYAMVTTLCGARGMHRVRFFFAGDMLETLGGSIYWAGDFLYNRTLVDQPQS